jgi:hypothetical protein
MGGFHCGSLRRLVEKNAELATGLLVIWSMYAAECRVARPQGIAPLPQGSATLEEQSSDLVDDGRVRIIQASRTCVATAYPVGRQSGSEQSA